MANWFNCEHVIVASTMKLMLCVYYFLLSFYSMVLFMCFLCFSLFPLFYVDVLVLVDISWKAYINQGTNTVGLDVLSGQLSQAEKRYTDTTKATCNDQDRMPTEKWTRDKKAHRRYRSPVTNLSVHVNPFDFWAHLENSR